MKKISSIIISLFCAPILVGCATPYVAPTGEHNSKVRLVVTENSFVGKAGVRAEALAGKDCKNSQRSVIAYLVKGPVLPTVVGSKHVDLGMAGGEDIPLYRKHEFEVKSGTEFSFAIHRPFMGPTAVAGTVVVVPECVASYSFIPEADQQYEIIYNYIFSSCNAVVYKITKLNNSKVERTKVNSENLSCTR